MDTAKFTYSISLVGLLPTDDNAAKAFGEGATIDPQFGPDALVRDRVDSLFVDALSGLYRMLGRWEVQHPDESQLTENDKSFHVYLNAKIKLYETWRDEIKLTNVEKI